LESLDEQTEGLCPAPLSLNQESNVSTEHIVDQQLLDVKANKPIIPNLLSLKNEKGDINEKKAVKNIADQGFEKEY